MYLHTSVTDTQEQRTGICSASDGFMLYYNMAETTTWWESSIL